MSVVSHDLILRDSDRRMDWLADWKNGWMAYWRRYKKKKGTGEEIEREEE